MFSSQDQHFKSAPLESNVSMVFFDTSYENFWHLSMGCNSLAFLRLKGLEISCECTFKLLRSLVFAY